MMRRHAWIAVAAALALAACDDDPAEADGGVDAAAPGEDAGGGGMDAGGGGGDEDAGGGGDEDAGAGDEDGGTADSGTMADAGPPLMVGDCAEAPITIQADCPEFTACGGTITEPDYCYTGICIEEEQILGELREACNSVSIESGSAMGRIAGRVSFSPTQLTRESVSHVEATFILPSTDCVAVLVCGSILEDQIESRVPGSTASCTTAGGDCRCDVTLETAVDMTEAYTADTGAGTLTLNVSERTFDYCLDDTSGTLQFVETTEGGTVFEPGVQSLEPAPAPAP